MCEADVGVVVFNWQKHHKAPHPNFNVQHKCRNFGDILRYAQDHAVDASTLDKDYFERPKDKPVVDFDEPPFDPDADE